jgi:GT2 family glycosyltransferase
MSFGIVVIGRNEGSRLLDCLASVASAKCPAVYVDSASSDGSASRARSCGIEVVELDPTAPLSAARARNQGFERLLEMHPSLRFVQFLDGDCVLMRGWLEAAARALEEEPQRAAVTGHLFERNASASAYKRLCALEWRSAPGDLKNYGHLGGISMIRAHVFRELRGFRADMIAGEDSELGIRMGLAGYKVTKIDIPMATHDANIQSFRQWWIRAVRGGHAIGQRSDIHGMSRMRDCVRERNSTFFWGIGLPLIVLLTLFSTRGASFLLLAAYPALGVRIWRYRRSTGDSSTDATLYATFVLIGKFANAVGLVKFFWGRFTRRHDLIEYK